MWYFICLPLQTWAQRVKRADSQLKQAEGQLCEVARRFDLAASARPFTLCLRCNLALESIDKQGVEHLLPGNGGGAVRALLPLPRLRAHLLARLALRAHARRARARAQPLSFLAALMIGPGSAQD